MNSSLSSIIYEQINEDYGYGNYLGLKLLIHRPTGMINATKLCNDTKKKMCHWLSNKTTKLLLTNPSIGIPIDDLIKEHKVSNDLKGTYIH